MVQTTTKIDVPAIQVFEEFKSIRQHEPHPLRATTDEVVSYVRQLQSIDFNLSRLLESAQDVSQSERAALELKRASIDAAIAQQVVLAARRMGRDRQGSLKTLNAIFKLGAKV